MKQLLKLIAVNLPEMSPETIQRWIEAPEIIRDGLVKMFFQIPFKIWKTIKIIVYQNADQCLEALKAAGCNVGDWARDLIKNKLDFTKSVEEKVESVKLSVAQLGFVEGATLRQILEKALQMGLLKCQPTDGPNLRVQYLDQPMGEVVWLGMDPITGSDGHPGIVYLRRSDSGLWLSAYYCNLGSFFSADNVFLFRRSK